MFSRSLYLLYCLLLIYVDFYDFLESSDEIVECPTPCFILLSAGAIIGTVLSYCLLQGPCSILFLCR